MKEKGKNKRREFLALGLIAGVGAISGAGVKKMITDAGNKKIKMITSSGEVVVVEARHIPKNRNGEPVSNAELKKWMDSEK